MDERIGVVGRLTAKAGKEEELAEILRQLSPLIRAHEPGMILHAIFRSPAKPREFVIVEVFRDQAAVDAHSKTDHFATVRPRVAALIEGEITGAVEVLKVLATG